MSRKNMLFGTEQSLLLIKQALYQESLEAYDLLCGIIYNDCKPLINKHCLGLQKADKEDLLQDIVWSVLRDLPRFYEASSCNTEQQRNAYLKRIAYNVCMDFFRKAKRSVLTNAVDITEIGDATTVDDFTRRIEDKSLFLDALKGAFEINTSPDKLIAFVFNRLLGALKGKNGSPKSIVERYDGIPLQVMYEKMVVELTHVLGAEVPQVVLQPLKDRVYGDYYDRPFHMSTHQIADGSNWIVEKVKEKSKNER